MTDPPSTPPTPPMPPTPSNEQNPKAWLPLLMVLGIALLVRVPFLFIVPMVEAPDEYAHFWVTRFLVEHFAAPDAAQVAAGGPSAVYGSLPPFAYLPHAFFALAIKGVDISFAERIGSIVGGLVTVFAAWKIGEFIFDSPEETRTRLNNLLRILLPLSVALHPQFVFVNAYCNSDSTAVALASLLMLVCMHAIFGGLTLRCAAVAGALSGLIALSKFSALAVVPVVLFAFVAAGWIYRYSISQTGARLAIAATAGAILSVPWFARNAAVFHGDWLGTLTMRETWAKTFDRSIEPVRLFSVLKQKVWWQQLFCSFWAVYGYQKHYLPSVFYGGYLLSIGVALGGTFTHLSQRLKKSVGEFPILFWSGADRDPESGSVAVLKQQAAWMCQIFSVALSCSGLLYAAVNNLGGPQGRYLFPSEIAFMALILFGLASIHEKCGKWLAVSFVGWNAIVLLYSIWMLYSMFGVHIKPY